MEIKFYNTLTKQKEIFTPLDSKTIKIYFFMFYILFKKSFVNALLLLSGRKKIEICERNERHDVDECKHCHCTICTDCECHCECVEE